MGRTRVGLPGVPDREDPQRAVDEILRRGYDACEIDFEGSFWMDYPWAERFGEIAREADVALSIHAPLFGFMGHLEASGRKFSSAVGALDRSAGIAKACGAAVVVFHPGFLLGRSREDAIASVVEQLGMLRERLEGKDRAVPFGIEVMGRVRDLGSLDDVARDLGANGLGAAGARLRPHARDERRRLPGIVAVRRGARGGRRRARAGSAVPHPLLRHRVREPQREASTCPTARERSAPSPLREALERFERPATVISESPDESSSQAIRAILAQRLTVREAGPLDGSPSSRAASPRPRVPRRPGPGRGGRRRAPRAARSDGACSPSAG